MNSREAHCPKSTKLYKAELINPNSLQTSVFSSHLPTHLSHEPGDPAPLEGPLSHAVGLAPIYVPELLLEQKKASALPGSMCAD